MTEWQSLIEVLKERMGKNGEKQYWKTKKVKLSRSDEKQTLETGTQ